MHVLNEGLRRFDSLIMLPIYQAFWIMSSVLTGIIYFQEYKAFDEMQAAMFTLGATMTLAGIYVLLHFRVEIPKVADNKEEVTSLL